MTYQEAKDIISNRIHGRNFAQVNLRLSRETVLSICDRAAELYAEDRAKVVGVKDQKYINALNDCYNDD